MIRYRYAAWDGSQDAFHPGPEDAGEPADYLPRVGTQKALGAHMQRGTKDDMVRCRVWDMPNRLRAMKEQQLRQYN
jgi:hypothetical protein